MDVPGPPALGRGVVVAGSAPPEAWAGAPVVGVDEAVLGAPAPAVRLLHEAWALRRPVVVDLAVDPARFRAPQAWTVEPWTLDPGFEPALDRLQFLVWANNYDARTGPPVWWWGRKAVRLGATEGGPADIVLPDGAPAWVDGGPRRPWPDGPGEPGSVVHCESVDLGRLSVVPPPAAPTAELAPDQLAAVAHRSGAARIVAPAGSGKTRVLTERLRHLLVDRAYDRETVLAVAYNKRAQLELEERSAAFRPRVSTLNALGLRLLGQARGRPPTVLDERDVRRTVERLIPAKRHRANTDPLAPYLEGLAAVRLGLRPPGEVEAERDDVPGLAAAFDPYRRALADAGAVDFDEQIYAAIEVLLGDGEFRRRAQQGCRHLLVDEFQDLTPAHVLLLRLLAVPGLEVFGVGDDDQCIYSYVGADPSFLLEYDDLFPGAASHPLEVNYRCPVAVVDGARSLLSYNHRRVPKEIRPGPAAEASPEALDVRRHPPTAGTATLVSIVRGWLDDDGVAFDSVAVLTRVNALLLGPHVALREASVPLASALGPDVLERTGVRAALAYLRIGADPLAVDPADVEEVMRRPSRGLPQWFPKWLRGRMTIDSVRAIADRLDDARVGDKVRSLADDLALVAEAVRGGTTRSALVAIRDAVGLGQAMEQLDGSKGGQTASQLDDLEGLLQVADLHPDAASFEPWLRSVFRREADPGGVTLSTVHRVKGMEWDRVVVFGATAGLLPHRLAEDVEEERRVMHVAVTRGRSRVVVLGDASRPSPFLDELAGTAERRAPAPVAARPPAVSRPAAARTRAPVHETLSRWRRERSHRDGVPAYVVAPNELLADLEQARPTSLVALGRVRGMGPKRLELYGDELLDVLRRL